jgi:hypothetical protein
MVTLRENDTPRGGVNVHINAACSVSNKLDCVHQNLGLTPSANATNREDKTQSPTTLSQIGKVQRVDIKSKLVRGDIESNLQG